MSKLSGQKALLNRTGANLLRAGVAKRYLKENQAADRLENAVAEVEPAEPTLVSACSTAILSTPSSVRQICASTVTRSGSRIVAGRWPATRAVTSTASGCRHRKCRRAQRKSCRMASCQGLRERRS